MNTDGLIVIIKKIEEIMEENKQYLTDLDMPIGDSDHGINMARGFSAVVKKLSEAVPDDAGTIFKQIGMTLVSQVGGSSGPLYGTAFMNAGKYAAGKTELAKEDFPEIIKAGIDGVKLRGKAEPGDATMLDAMLPAYEAALEAYNSGSDIKAMAAAAATAAQAGAESTVPMIAKKGRASYVGERGIGHMDPGAASFALIMKAVENGVIS